MRPTYASDIYSLGATCIYLLTGKAPKDMGYHSRTGALDWERHVSHLSHHFQQVLQKMMEMAVRDRYQSAQAVLDALEMEVDQESLSQGLVKRNSLGNSGNVDQSQPESYCSSWSAQLAESIRQRRTRMGLPTSRTQRDQSQSYYSKGRLTGGKSKSSSSRKLTANEVINQYKQGRRDFSQANLYRLDLQEANLNRSIFRTAQLIQVNFQKADLREADFANAILRRTSLREAKLHNAFFSNADLQKADFCKADLTLANFQNAKLAEANFCGANLTNAKITEKQLAEAKTNWATIMPNGKRAFLA